MRSPTIVIVLLALALAGCDGMFIPTIPPSLAAGPPTATPCVFFAYGVLLDCASGLPIPPAQPATVTPGPTPTPPPTPTIPICTVRTGVYAGDLNLRVCPGMDCGVVAVLEEGETVTLVQPGADWTQVYNGKVIGWAASRYLECVP